MKFIFLVYFPRSGSTFLARKLSALSDDVLVLPEAKFVEMLLLEGKEAVAKGELEEIACLLESDPRWPNLQISSTALRDILKERQTNGVLAIIEGLCLHCAKQQGKENASLCLIKSGTLLWLYDSIRQLFPKSIFLHIRRDPRAAISSLMRTKAAFHKGKNMAPPNPVLLAKRWVRYMRQVEHLSIDGSIVECTYESLCIDFDRAMHTLMNKLGIRQFAEVAGGLRISEAERTIHPHIDKAPMMERLSGWKKELPAHWGFAIEHFTKGYIKELYFSNLLSSGKKRWVLTSLYLKSFGERIQHVFRLIGKLFSSRDIRQIAYKIKYKKATKQF